MKMSKREAGALGGKALVAKYGREHMSLIGKRGYAVTRSRYDLVPYGATAWAFVTKDTRQIVKIWR